MATTKTRPQKTQRQKEKLTKRSVPKAANELKVVFDKHLNKQIFRYLKEVELRFKYIASYCDDIRPKIINAIKSSQCPMSFLSTIRSRLRDVGYKKDAVSTYVDSIEKAEKSNLLVENFQSALIYLLDNYDYVSLRDMKLTVQTDDIFVTHKGSGTLVGFGAFDIILDLNKLNYVEEDLTYAFRCRALNPRTINGCYTHPNLNSDNKMCVGEGYESLRKCLRDGRIDDFMDIVQQVLRTYSHSPYSSMESWMK